MDIKVSRQKMKKSTDPFSLWTDQKDIVKIIMIKVMMNLNI